MNSIQAITPNYYPKYRTNFRADDNRQVRDGVIYTEPDILKRSEVKRPVQSYPQPVVQYSQQSNPIDEYNKQKKKQHTKQNIGQAVSIGAGLAIIASVIGSFILMKKGGSTEQKKELGYLLKEDFDKMIKDTSSEKSFEEMFLPPELEQKLKEIKDKISRGDVYKKMHLPDGTRAMLLYGPPGTGKNTFTFALSKMFKDAMLFEMDMTKIAAPYYGVPEKNLQAATEYAKHLAEELKSQNKKLIIFMDEIDRMMLQDSGTGAKHTNDLLTEFKRCFNELKQLDNVTIIGATNKEIDQALGKLNGTGVLDETMLNRFGDKIFVSRPTSKALAHATADNFKNAEMVDKMLQNGENKYLTEFYDIIAGDKHKFSFRTLQDNIYDKIIPPENGNLTLKELIDAARTSKDAIYLDNGDLEKLKKLEESLKHAT